MKNSSSASRPLANPYSSCDDLIVKYQDGKLWFYVVELKLAPWVGCYALPGAAIRADETLDDTMRRVYFEALGEKQPLYAEQLYTFSGLKRDSRSRSISTSYIVIPKPGAGEKIENSVKYGKGEWRDLKNPGKLAFDHNEMVKKGFDRIAGKLLYSTLGVLLLPKEFTLTELQNLYEFCGEKGLDKRNFRKKILSLGIIEETGKMKTGGKSRPAMLYKATSLKLEIINFLG
jgi:8-oxo-dGTP diphosphatase